MAAKPDPVLIYHITDVANLPSILRSGGLFSDATLPVAAAQIIGYSHIKQRRMTELRVPCCGNAFVGQFVPFYFCPRSPMLYTINLGNTDRLPGCQRSIVHLVGRMMPATQLGRDWAISDGNAGSYYPTYGSSIEFLDSLDWDAINARIWKGRQHQKMSEFLVRDFLPWNLVEGIGVFDAAAEANVRDAIAGSRHQPTVTIQPDWYYL